MLEVVHFLHSMDVIHSDIKNGKICYKYGFGLFILLLMFTVLYWGGEEVEIECVCLNKTGKEMGRGKDVDR